MMAGFRSVNQPFRPSPALPHPAPDRCPPAPSHPLRLPRQPSDWSPEKALPPAGGFGPRRPQALGLDLQVLSPPLPPHSLFGEELPVWGQGTRSPYRSWCSELRAGQSPGHGSLNATYSLSISPPTFASESPSRPWEDILGGSQGSENLRLAVWFLPFPLPLSLGTG